MNRLNRQEVALHEASHVFMQALYGKHIDLIQVKKSVGFVAAPDWSLIGTPLAHAKKALCSAAGPACERIRGRDFNCAQEDIRQIRQDLKAAIMLRRDSISDRVRGISDEKMEYGVNWMIDRAEKTLLCHWEKIEWCAAYLIKNARQDLVRKRKCMKLLAHLKAWTQRGVPPGSV